MTARREAENGMLRHYAKAAALTLALLMLAASGCVGETQTPLPAETREAAATPEQTQTLAPTPEMTATPVSTPEPTKEPVANDARYMAYARKADRDVGLDALTATNPDVIGWISVPGTAVDYPVVYTSKLDSYYLDHDVYGEESKAGAVFMEDYNTYDFTDNVTLVYGHNMKDGSMFASLHSFEDAVFFDEHRSIFLYIGDIMLEYRIFAAYEAGNAHILAENDLSELRAFESYMVSVFENRDMNAMIDDTVKIEYGSRVLTLVTCVKGDHSKRYFVQGVLLENEGE